MAPLTRGSTQQRGSQLRGRGSGRRRGNPNSRGGRTVRTVRCTPRQSEKLAVGKSDEIQRDEAVDISRSETSEDDQYDSLEENNVPVTSRKPYNALLQSLQEELSKQPPENALINEPVRKKRRLSPQTEPDPASSSSELRAQISTLANEDEPEESEGELEEVELNEVEAHDAFDVHFANADMALLQENIRAIEVHDWKICKSVLPSGWMISRNCLPCGSSTCKPISAERCDVETLQLKQKLEGSASSHLPVLEDLNAIFAKIIFGYQDLFFTDRTQQNAKHLRVLSCLHALNHIFKTRDRVIKNNARALKDDPKDDSSKISEQESREEKLRDQGFTRPKVLMLLPTRHSCVRVVDTMTSLCAPEQQENRKRFQDEYVQTKQTLSENKPEDFRELFAGNDDDMFRLGIKFTRKTVKYYSTFYNSDIIIASPLGLKMAIGGTDQKHDHDFLSSIEILVVDQTDALLMQNWQHVSEIFENLNLLPKETHGCDFSRVRNWYLDGNAKYLRQTIVLSSFISPELNAIFGNSMFNASGKVKVTRKSYDGAMLELPLQLRQTFSRYDTLDPVNDLDVRLKLFIDTILPGLIRSSTLTTGQSQGVLIFIASYMDFVRVRNYLEESNTTQNISFGAISEYTPVRDIARARSHFLSGRHSVLLYTGRAHHFRRLLIRGAKKIIMYSLPENPIFYKEVIAYLATSVSEGQVDARDANVRIIFSKYDALKLERIVGSKRLLAMLREKGGDTFDFM